MGLGSLDGNEVANLVSSFYCNSILGNSPMQVSPAAVLSQQLLSQEVRIKQAFFPGPMRCIAGGTLGVFCFELEAS